MGLNHDVKKGENGSWIGDPTEIALIEYLEEEYGESYVRDLLKQVPRVAEIPFDSDRKCMSTIHRVDDKYLVISKGAIEVVADILEDQSIREKIKHLGDDLASNGIRVLAFAYKEINALPEKFSYEEVEKDLVYAGLVGMIDPPREEVRDAIRECKTAGISPVMITGDHRETAAAIARDIGILNEGELALTGSELAALSPDELDEKVERIKVYARVSPEQKLNIVKSLQRKSHFIAMTGDGVNDAPSLKRANIGIAMGITGTDVSKEASDMILLDDNFATIVKAVKEGRTIYDNIKKFIKYIMTCNGAEILTIFFAPLLGLPIPLLPIHILWINLVTDGLPGLALSYEKPDKDIMELPPRKSDESLLSKGIYIHIIWVGILMAAVTIGLQAYAIDAGKENWQTMVFTVLSLSQLGHVFAIRSDRELIFRKGIFSNMPLVGAILLTFLLQMAVIYLPFANEVLKTQPLSLNEVLICIVISCVVFTGVEIEKLVKAQYRKRNGLNG